MLAGCGTLDVWPLKGDSAKSADRSRAPANATEYQCAANKRFYVRPLDGGNSVWLILPEREFRLDKLAGDGSRYGNGVAVLELNGNEARLADGTATNYSACKTPGPAGN